MDGHVDWLTWTMVPVRQPENIQDVYHIIRRSLKEISDEHEGFVFNGSGFDRAPRISNFNLCLAREDRGGRIGGQSPSGRVIVDISGRGCNSLYEHEFARRIVMGIADNITRFDYAIDIHTGVLPSEFVNARSHNGFRSISYIKSGTGETVYVGSPKSDRFSRVYRYYPPHPRADLLRMECVFRRGMARAAAGEYCSEEDTSRFHAKLANTWGFAHRVFDVNDVTDEKINVPTVSGHDEDTIAWLYKQVAPALARVMATGAFDMADWLERVYNMR